jgi:hypothetical protein
MELFTLEIHFYLQIHLFLKDQEIARKNYQIHRLSRHSNQNYPIHLEEWQPRHHVQTRPLHYSNS